MKYVPGVLTHNWKLKLASLGLAIFLWAVVRQPAEQQEVRAVPVQVQLEAAGWTLVGEPIPDEVRVRFGGSMNDIANLAFNPPPLVIPIDRVHSRDTVVDVRGSWIRLDGRGNVFPREIRPEAVRLHFDRLGRTAVPVAPRFTGELPQDLVLADSIAVSPSVVRVRGPTALVEALDSIPLQPLDLGSVRSSGSYGVTVDTTGLGDVEPTTREVSLQIQVEPRQERVIGGVSVRPSGEATLEDGFVVEPATVQLTLIGPRSRVEAMDAGALRVVFPAEVLEGLEVGGARRAPIRVEGVPRMVRVTAPADSVTVRRPEPDGGEGGEGGG